MMKHQKGLKHVFFLHSKITEIAMELTIATLSLKKEDVIVFSGRGYQPMSPYCHPDFSIGLSVNSYRFVYHLAKKMRKLTETIKAKYIAYIPNSTVLDCSLLILHKLCVGYCYIEEGLASYLGSNYDVKYLRNPRFPYLFKMPNPWFCYTDFFSFVCRPRDFNITHPKYCGSFALSDRAFPNDAKRVLLPLSDFSSGTDVRSFFNSMGKVDSCNPCYYDCVVAFDACGVYNYFSETKFEHLLTDYIGPFLRGQGYARIAYKLHPEHFSGNARGATEARFVRDFFSREFPHSQELDRRFSLEHYFAGHPSTDAVVFYSSVGYYASLFGAKVYSLHKRLYEINKDIRLPEFLDDIYIDI